jgi:hypothetical protein
MKFVIIFISIIGSKDVGKDVVLVAVTLYNCIWEGLGSNLCPNTALLTFILVFVSPSRIIPE